MKHGNPGIPGTLVAIPTMFFNEPGVQNSIAYFRSAWVLGAEGIPWELGTTDTNTGTRLRLVPGIPISLAQFPAGIPSLFKIHTSIVLVFHFGSGPKLKSGYRIGIFTVTNSQLFFAPFINDRAPFSLYLTQFRYSHRNTGRVLCL